MTIGERIESLRKTRKLSQDEISKKLGIPQSNYSRLVKKGNDIPVDFMFRVSKILEKSPDYFIYEDYSTIEEEREFVKEFGELTLLYWLHDSIFGIEDVFNHAIDEPNILKIETPGQKEKLISFLVSNYAHKEFASKLSHKLEYKLVQMLKKTTIYIFFESMENKMVAVDLITENEDGSRSIRRLSKPHLEL